MASQSLADKSYAAMQGGPGLSLADLAFSGAFPLSAGSNPGIMVKDDVNAPGYTEIRLVGTPSGDNGYILASNIAGQIIIGGNDTSLINLTGPTALSNNASVAGAAKTLGFFGAAGAGKQVVAGSKGANAALTSLIAALVAHGLITDTTT